MSKKFILFLCLLSISFFSHAQIRIRIFAEQNPEQSLFTVTNGSYYLAAAGDSVRITKGRSVLVSFHNGKLAVKPSNHEGYLCDSVKMNPASGSCSFSMRINGNNAARRDYTGRLSCYPDLGSVLLINNADIEQYVAGVVRTEGGTDQNPEYFKTQAVIARTYMYKYSHRHLRDGYNLCDNTHCQAFNGISTDSSIIEAARATHNLVILDRDSVLIYSAFHSNCGGETLASEDVWLTDLQYLRKV
jgi:stage II sporulation protein D